MAMTPRISAQTGAARAPSSPGTDVVRAAPCAVVPAPLLRAAAGYRVDGPDGRIGVLHGLAPAAPAGPPELLLVTVGLFIVTTISIQVAEVRSIDMERRRIVIASTPPLPRRSPAELARRVRRFVRMAARRAAGEGMTTPSRRE